MHTRKHGGERLQKLFNKVSHRARTYPMFSVELPAASQTVRDGQLVYKSLAGTGCLSERDGVGLNAGAGTRIKPSKPLVSGQNPMTGTAEGCCADRLRAVLRLRWDGAHLSCCSLAWVDVTEV